MRDRQEVIEEIHDARRDLAQNLDALRDAVEEKLDVRAQLDERLEPLRVQTRARPRTAVCLAAAAGAVFALILTSSSRDRIGALALIR